MPNWCNTDMQIENYDEQNHTQSQVPVAKAEYVKAW